MPSERHGYYSQNPEGEVYRVEKAGPGAPELVFQNPALKPWESIERVDFEEFIEHPEKADNKVEVLLVSGIHADEGDVAEILKRILAHTKSTRLQAFNPNIYAAMTNTRGAVIPLLEDNEYTGKATTFNAREAYEVDLNRQFKISENNRTYDEVIGSLKYPEARMLMTLLRDYRFIKYGMSFHQDSEFGGEDEENYESRKGRESPPVREGFYFYDMIPDARNDEDAPLVMDLKQKLQRRLIEEGFLLLNGKDDLSDPALGLLAVDGYIQQPVVDKDGNRKLDGTFESAAIELGRQNIGNMKRAFTFEIPGGLSPERKELMTRIILAEFVAPFLQAKGIDFEFNE